MKLHGNAALSLKKRKLLVSRVLDQDWSLAKAAAAAEVSERTAGKWVKRFAAEGPAGLLDRSSAPKHVHNRTDERRVQVIAALRRLRMTGAEIAEVLGMPQTTVSGLLKEIGMGKLGRLGLEPAERYERKRPGELIHVDVKKLGRIQGGVGKRWRDGNTRYQNRVTDRDGHRRNTVGWEFVHVAVDDATRLAYVEVLPDEKAKTAVGFLGRAVRFFRRYGIRVERVLTDNGSPYVSTIHALACRILGLRHLRTRPYRPQTNGKAERFIRTMLGGWAYGAVYGTSAERTAALDGWLWRYNHERPHGALGRKPPSARLAELNNLLGSYS
jgi:transposase InsO family protein